MKYPSLWQISITTSIEAEEAVGALLERVFGQPASVYLPDESQQPVVTVFSSQRIPNTVAERKRLGTELQRVAESGLDISPATISIRKVPRQDWSESWKKCIKNIEIGRSLLIKPSWSARRARGAQVVVVLDPGLSFGTGQHPTTVFCLKQIVSCRSNGAKQSLLDIGTGSGLLAIAAAKLGYWPVRAFDHDPVAVRIAKANARRNRVQNLVSITRNDLTRLPLESKRKYDVVCANLVDSLLIESASRILGRLRTGGKLVVAGILEKQFLKVQEAYEAIGLQLGDSEVESNWKSGCFSS